jgi:hypothetical protein
MCPFSTRQRCVHGVPCSTTDLEVCTGASSLTPARRLGSPQGSPPAPAAVHGERASAKMLTKSTKPTRVLCPLAPVSNATSGRGCQRSEGTACRQAQASSDAPMYRLGSQMPLAFYLQATRHRIVSGGLIGPDSAGGQHAFARC